MGQELLLFFDHIFSSPLFISAMLGAAIGFERELSGKDPSLRTFSLISLGACIFAILSEEIATMAHLSGNGRFADPARIAAQIIPGIGFIGAGAIFRSKAGVSGSTTAALMWVTASIGMAVGFRHTVLAIDATFVALFMTLMLRGVHKFLRWVRYTQRPKGSPAPSVADENGDR